jgi:hypothetical protein
LYSLRALSSAKKQPEKKRPKEDKHGKPAKKFFKKALRGVLKFLPLLWDRNESVRSSARSAATAS